MNNLSTELILTTRNLYLTMKFMHEFIKKIKKKVNGIIFTLITTGIVLLILAVLVVWTDFVLRLVIALFVIVVAYIFFYLAYKIWHLKKAVEKHFKIW